MWVITHVILADGQKVAIDPSLRPRYEVDSEGGPLSSMCLNLRELVEKGIPNLDATPIIIGVQIVEESFLKAESRSTT